MPRLPNGFIPTVSQGYSYQGPNGVMESEVGGGMPRYALDYDRGVQQFDVTFVLNPLEHQVFTHFYHNTIKKGAIGFDMPLNSGTGVVDHSVNIVPGTYSVTFADVNVIVVSFSVKAESQAYANPEAGAALIDIYNEYGHGTHALLAALEKFATVDSNVLDFGPPEPVEYPMTLLLDFANDFYGTQSYE